MCKNIKIYLYIIMRKTKRQCGRRARRKTMRGGTWRGKAAGPVGLAWNGGDVSSWPGKAGLDGQSNYIPLSKEGVPSGNFELPVSTSNIMKGGKKKRCNCKSNCNCNCKCKHKKHGRTSRAKRGKSRRGKSRRGRGRRGGCGCGSSSPIQTGGSGLVRGRLFPEDLVNAYRGIVNAPSRWMNTWGGLSQPANLNVNPSHQPIDKTDPLQFKVGSRISPSDNTTSSLPL
jgi:hypothetical protein